MLGVAQDCRNSTFLLHLVICVEFALIREPPYLLEGSDLWIEKEGRCLKDEIAGDENLRGTRTKRTQTLNLEMSCSPLLGYIQPLPPI
jgi:hypothetical protein